MPLSERIRAILRRTRAGRAAIAKRAAGAPRDKVLDALSVVEITGPRRVWRGNYASIGRELVTPQPKPAKKNLSEEAKEKMRRTARMKRRVKK